MWFLAVCDVNAHHAVKNTDWRAIKGRSCQASGCGGTYAVIVLKSTNAPRSYKKPSATVRFGGKRIKVTGVDLSDRQLMRDTLTGQRKRRVEEQIERMRKQVAAEPVDVSDGGDYIGEAAPFKGVHTRLSMNGSYAERPGLAGIITNRAFKQKIKLQSVSIAVDRGGGQWAAKNGRSAEAVSGRQLLHTDISDGAGGSRAAPCSEEWCHLQAACLGGNTISNNLVAASYACNTYMMAIETYIRNRNELKISVSAYCSDNAGDVAEAIRYKIYRTQGSGQQQLFSVLIDARAQHFSKNDFDTLKQLLESSVKVTTIGI